MKKTYIVPTLQVDEAEIVGSLMVTSIHLSDGTGNEEYVKEQNAEEDGWNIDW